MVFTKVTTRWQGRLVEQHHKRFSHGVAPLSCTLDSRTRQLFSSDPTDGADGIQDPAESRPSRPVPPLDKPPLMFTELPVMCIVDRINRRNYES